MSPVRILLVGEGSAEYGRASHEGVLQPVLRRIIDASADELEFEARKVSSLPKRPGRPKGKRHALRGNAGKAFQAFRLAKRDHDALVFVIDADRKRQQREEDIQKGLRVAREDSAAAALPVVVGLPKETLEAWLLGDAGAFERSGLGSRPALPRKKTEELWGDRRDPESNHPKRVLERVVAGLTSSREGRALGKARRLLARYLDPDALGEACPVSFAPFRDQVRERIGPLLASRSGGETEDAHT